MEGNFSWAINFLNIQPQKALNQKIRKMQNNPAAAKNSKTTPPLDPIHSEDSGLAELFDGVLLELAWAGLQERADDHIPLLRARGSSAFMPPATGTSFASHTLIDGTSNGRCRCAPGNRDGPLMEEIP